MKCISSDYALKNSALLEDKGTTGFRKNCTHFKQRRNQAVAELDHSGHVGRVAGPFECRVGDDGRRRRVQQERDWKILIHDGFL